MSEIERKSPKASISTATDSNEKLQLGAAASSSATPKIDWIALGLDPNAQVGNMTAKSLAALMFQINDQILKAHTIKNKNDVAGLQVAEEKPAKDHEKLQKTVIQVESNKSFGMDVKITKK